MITSLYLVLLLNTEWRLAVKLQGLAILDYVTFIFNKVFNIFSKVEGEVCHFFQY